MRCWNRINIILTYCRSLLEKSKSEQIERIKRKQQEKLLEISAAASTPLNYMNENTITEPNRPGKFCRSCRVPGNSRKCASRKKTHSKNKKNERPIRGVETMFRVSSSNHQRLSVMADNKAHIMISVNSIIVSVALRIRGTQAGGQ